MTFTLLARYNRRRAKINTVEVNYRYDRKMY